MSARRYGMAIMQCNQCWQYLDESPDEERKPCPLCGGLGRNIAVEVTDLVTVRDQRRMKAKHAGDKRPFLESVSGSELHRDTGEWRDVQRVVDREGDHYSERITDVAGNVVREVDEPLSDHRGHGAAKRRPPTDPPP
jgi:hypothetical protein